MSTLSQKKALFLGYSQSNKYKWFGGIGGLAIVIGVLLVVLGDPVNTRLMSYFNSRVGETLLLDSENAIGFESWRTNTKPDGINEYRTYYLWNVTNPDGVMAGETAELQEVGPYVYRVNYEKYNITWENDHNSIKYQTWTYYTFVPEQSIDDELLITSINLPMLGIWPQIRGTSLAAVELRILDLNSGGVASQFLVTHTAKEWLWGWEDPVLAVVQQLQPTIPTYYPGTGRNQTSKLPDSKSPWDMLNTGKSDITKARQYEQFKEHPILEICSALPCPPNEYINPWGSIEANRVGGTNGLTFHLDVQREERLEMWNIGTQRRDELVYDSDTKVSGIDVYKFKVNSCVFGNTTVCPENEAYYQFGPSGLANLTAVSFGVPIFLSKPHFLDSSSDLQGTVKGFTPDPTVHDTFFNIEPITGNTLEARSRLQINFQVEPLVVGDTVWYPNIKPGFFPIAWQEQSGLLTQTQADYFVDNVYRSKTEIEIAHWGMIGFGSAFLCIGVICVYFAIQFRKEEMRFKYKSVAVSQIHADNEEFGAVDDLPDETDPFIVDNSSCASYGSA